MSRHAHAVPGYVEPHKPIGHAPARWRLVKPGTRLKGCPLRHDHDAQGDVWPICCTDIKGTLEACRVCQR